MISVKEADKRRINLRERVRLTPQSEGRLRGSGSGMASGLLTFITFAQMPGPLQWKVRSHTFALSPRMIGVLLASILSTLLCSAVFFRFNSLKRSSRRAEREARKRIRETDDVTDDLLQGVQGLMLTFHVAAQKLSEDHASKILLDHALSEADELLSNGRRRFEQAAFQATAEDSSIAGNLDRGESLGILKHRYLESSRPEREQE